MIKRYPRAFSSFSRAMINYFDVAPSGALFADNLARGRGESVSRLLRSTCRFRATRSSSANPPVPGRSAVLPMVAPAHNAEAWLHVFEPDAVSARDDVRASLEQASVSLDVLESDVGEV